MVGLFREGAAKVGFFDSAFEATTLLSQDVCHFAQVFFSLVRRFHLRIVFGLVDEFDGRRRGRGRHGHSCCRSCRRRR